MSENTARVRITEDELARDTHAVLTKVQAGVEVIVEQNHRPVAVIKIVQAPGRKLSECLALAKAYEAKLGYAPTPDPEFGKDVQEGIDARTQPLNPSSWD
jgi:antitoxin (DNA-binding transcriptional repressor) of toxin-antitoxin stability system